MNRDEIIAAAKSNNTPESRWLAKVLRDVEETEDGGHWLWRSKQFTVPIPAAMREAFKSQTISPKAAIQCLVKSMDELRFAHSATCGVKGCIRHDHVERRGERITGSITAPSGAIGGWAIGAHSPKVTTAPIESTDGPKNTPEGARERLYAARGFVGALHALRVAGVSTGDIFALLLCSTADFPAVLDRLEKGERVKW